MNINKKIENAEFNPENLTDEDMTKIVYSRHSEYKTIEKPVWWLEGKYELAEVVFQYEDKHYQFPVERVGEDLSFPYNPYRVFKKIVQSHKWVEQIDA